MKIRLSFVELVFRCGAAVGGLIALVSIANCSAPKQVDQPAPVNPPKQISAADFVGNQSCAPCHPNEFKEHNRGKHATTAAALSDPAAKPFRPPKGAIPGTIYSIERDGKHVFQRNQAEKDSASLEVSFGSGKSAITYVGNIQTDQFTELRMSYVPSSKKWIVTPGQENDIDLGFGRIYVNDFARKCFECHASSVPPGPLPPAPKLLGVGCESCHGPGAAHVTAANAGKPAGTMADLAKLTGHEINQACGKCHRSATDVPLTSLKNVTTNRFQTYGLEASPCFKLSNGKLNCVTCHSPHKDLETRDAPYIKACLACHSPSANADIRGTNAPVRICPVNATDKCIGCHMPKRPLMPGSQIKGDGADHLIMAYRKPSPTVETGPIRSSGR
jgi:bacterioferritin-associated ferredoxin